MVVTGISVLLAIGSCFIPVRDLAPTASPQAEQLPNPTLPTQRTAPARPTQSYATDQILLAKQQVHEDSPAVGKTAKAGIASSTRSAAGAPPKASADKPQTSRAGSATDPSPSPDLYNGAPDLKLMQILPVNQGGQF
jgi:hypothetical protein